VVEHVVLGPHRYSVEFLKELSKKRRVGEADLVLNTIRIRDDQAASGLRSTMLHEIMHHALWLSGTRHAEGWSQEIEEACIVGLESYLLELFTRPENAPLREWLCE
jgi:hypothetical protein